jgi:phospholipid transport system substrate-binding protein
MKKIKAIIILATLMISPSLFAQSSPVPMLEKVADEITTVLKNNNSKLRNNHQIIHRAVERYLLPVVDVTGMSRSVLGREAWNKATIAEKKQFIKEFTQLVIRTYANPLAKYSGEKIKFLPLRGPVNGRFVRVSSVIERSNGANIPLNYSMISKKGQWKIYDLTVEGVSLLQSFRSQFNQILQNSSMAELIVQMQKSKAG